MPLLQRLKRVREERRMDPRELSARSGVSTDSISDFEELRRMASSRTTRRLAEALGVRAKTSSSPSRRPPLLLAAGQGDDRRVAVPGGKVVPSSFYEVVEAGVARVAARPGVEAPAVVCRLPVAARQESHQDRLGLQERGPVLLCEGAGGGVHLEVLAVGHSTALAVPTARLTGGSSFVVGGSLAPLLCMGTVPFHSQTPRTCSGKRILAMSRARASAGGSA